MNPVPPLTTILMEFLLSGGAEQTNSLANGPRVRQVWILLLKSSSMMLKKSASRETLNGER